MLNKLLSEEELFRIKNIYKWSLRNTLKVSITMIDFINHINKYINTTNLQTIFDVGSMNGDDAEILVNSFKHMKCYAIEGLKDNFELYIKNKKNIIGVNRVIASYDGKIKFHQKNINGIHGIYDRGQIYGNICHIYQCSTLKTIMKEFDIPIIDIIKIDVEGATYDALISLEKHIENIKIMHIETETYPFFEGQVLHNNVCDFLEKHNFELIEITFAEITHNNYQSDSVWVNKRFKKLFNDIKINPLEYQNTLPFPYMKQDNFLDEDFAIKIQEEILNIPDSDWDRYDNPFEQKYTLRNKYNFPPNLRLLFEKLESEDFISKLSNICGYKLILDDTRNFWGVHKYDSGDKLDIHTDAGLHPVNKLKKQITLGIYLSSNWKKEYECELEIWKGDKKGINEKIDSIEPYFNRLIVFTCNDYAWHGNPEPCKSSNESKRIFVTISYLSENFEDENKKVKACFVTRPEDPVDLEKDKLRLLRADPERYKEVYKYF